MEINEAKEQFEAVASSIREFRHYLADVACKAFGSELSLRVLAKRAEEHAAEQEAEADEGEATGFTREEVIAFLAWLSDSLEEIARDASEQCEDLDDFDSSGDCSQTLQALMLLLSVNADGIQRKLGAVRCAVEEAKQKYGMQPKEVATDEK